VKRILHLESFYTLALIDVKLLQKFFLQLFSLVLQSSSSYNFSRVSKCVPSLLPPLDDAPPVDQVEDEEEQREEAEEDHVSPGKSVNL